jgi:hypothetical protein
MDKLVQTFSARDVGAWADRTDRWARELITHKEPAGLVLTERLYRIRAMKPGAQRQPNFSTHLRIDLDDANAVRAYFGLAAIEDEIPDKDFYSVPEITSALGVTNEWLYRLQRDSPLKATRDDDARTIPISDAREWFGKRYFLDLPRGRYADEDIAANIEGMTLGELRAFAETAGFPLASEYGPTVFPRNKVLRLVESFRVDPKAIRQKADSEASEASASEALEEGVA